MNKRTIFLLVALCLVGPLMFFGCSGDDGAAGPAGATGATGATGPGGPPGSGVVADETCVLCHSTGKLQNVASMHRTDQSPGSMTVTIQSVTFGAPAGDNVPVTVNFTVAATDSAGADITPSIDLRTESAGALSYAQFALAKFVPGQSGSPGEWNGFIERPGLSGSRPFSAVASAGMTGTPATGVYSYAFPDNAIRVSDGYVDNVIMRAAVQVSGVPITLFTSDPYFNKSVRRPAANKILDVTVPVGGGTGVPTNAALLAKNDVSIGACNKCHDPLGIHGGARREYKFCQVCHNAKVEIAGNPNGGGYDNGNLVRLVHGIHRGWNLGSRTATPAGIGDFSEVAFPQDIRNCTTCHQGTEADNTYDNWKNRPSRTACGSCHRSVNFATGANHVGGVQPDDSFCALCHGSTAIPGYHAAKEGAPPTPNNPVLAGSLKAVGYEISSVTVDNTNAAIVKFNIKIDNVVANLGASGDNVTRPTGFTGGPSFLFAYTLPQDGVAAPADYNNLGRTAGQPQSVSIVGLPITAFDNTWYTVKVNNAFPAGAKMRAVALQGYFTQTSVAGVDVNEDGVPDNVARHTIAVMKAVTGDAVRRPVVKSGGYDANGVGTPTGCLECHQAFEGHGGNRVNNVQVCVMCHNPNLTSSGRTITASPINPAITALYGTDPLQYPEVANNFKSLIHGIHSSSMRTNEFVDIRNRLDGVLVLGDHVTFPGDLSHCTKCHVGTTYQNVQVANSLLTTEKVTTGVAGETLAQINAARASVPNATDLVDSPTASACGYCHDSSTAVSHFLTQGAEVKSKRADALVAPPLLLPDVLATP